MLHYLDHIETPIGRFALVVDEDAHLVEAGFTDQHTRMEKMLQTPCHALVPRDDPSGLSSKLRAYFAGDLRALDDIMVRYSGTSFQEEVWKTLRNIPCGDTWSYGMLARTIGRPKAVRAVGTANGANPVAVVVPCHRVVGSDGKLTGYAGGLHRKEWLLAHESSQLSLLSS